MASLQVTCISPPAYSRPPRVHLPSLDVFEQVQAAIASIPDPAELLSQFMDKLRMALMPIRKYLQLIEAVLAIKGCIEAIPKAIMQFSPSPVFDCFKNLIRAIAPLIQDVPPISIVQALLDVAGFGIDLINATLTTLTKLDNKIARLLDLNAYAQGLDDLELVRFTGCGLNSVGLSMQQLMDVLKGILPLVSLLIGVILKAFPSPEAQRASEDMITAGITFQDASDTLQGLDISVVGFPELDGLGNALLQTHNALVTIYNFAAPLIGEAGDKVPMQGPLEWAHF